MAREQTLLERFAVRESGRRSRFEPTTAENAEALMESVRKQLRRLLNARHGMSEAQPDYGLPAFTDLIIGSGDYVAAIQDAIRVAVEKYEPRLQRVRISRVVDDERDRRTLAFRIDAVLVGRAGEHRVWYQTSVAGNGQFDVTD